VWTQDEVRKKDDDKEGEWKADMAGGHHFWHSFCGLADMCPNLCCVSAGGYIEDKSPLATHLRSLCPQKGLEGLNQILVSPFYINIK